mmetsp:Transcript_19209/g.19507  ORF Transcript_19209/g.19507 Transcript_19209/m.19507 type:complete len:177 (-) Transcript_19209:97-627(-)
MTTTTTQWCITSSYRKYIPSRIRKKIVNTLPKPFEILTIIRFKINRVNRKLSRLLFWQCRYTMTTIPYRCRHVMHYSNYPKSPHPTLMENEIHQMLLHIKNHYEDSVSDVNDIFASCKGTHTSNNSKGKNTKNNGKSKKSRKCKNARNINITTSATNDNNNTIEIEEMNDSDVVYV